MKASAFLLPFLAVPALAATCSSPSMPHASCATAVKAAASCSDLFEEIVARITSGSWADPHNGGTYSLLKQSNTTLQLKRVTGNHKPGPYTDMIEFTASGSGSTCVLEGCSASQSTSVGDFSTNYCNQRNLYCGSKDGCKFVKHDISIMEGSVKPSIGAGKDASQCLGKAEAEVEDTPCCQTCTGEKKKYYSIVSEPKPMCGECCIPPSEYRRDHIFEPHLKPADGTNTPCADYGYPHYDSTVTHGAFNIKVTLDLYALPQCPNTTYCCPDAKHCLTPTQVSCAADASVCKDPQVCCPLTKLCVDVGEVCVPQCADGGYCCPDAKACLTPTNPGKLCSGMAGSCALDEICCPLTKECVTVGEKCML